MRVRVVCSQVKQAHLEEAIGRQLTLLVLIKIIQHMTFLQC